MHTATAEQCARATEPPDNTEDSLCTKDYYLFNFVDFSHLRSLRLKLIVYLRVFSYCTGEFLGNKELQSKRHFFSHSVGFLYRSFCVYVMFYCVLFCALLPFFVFSNRPFVLTRSKTKALGPEE